MSNFIKYYRKKDSKSNAVTHHAAFVDMREKGYYITFNPLKEAQIDFPDFSSAERQDYIFHTIEALSEFDKFIKEYNFEEVEPEISSNSALDECVAREDELSSNPLQLKMPVVGRRYISLNDYGSGKSILKVRHIENGRVYPKGVYSSIALKTFFDYFEELPDQDNSNKPVETEKEMQEGKWHHFKNPMPDANYKVEVSANNAQIEKAKEELRKHIKFVLKNAPDKDVWTDSWSTSYFNLSYFVQNLLNALDAPRDTKPIVSDEEDNSRRKSMEDSIIPKKDDSNINELTARTLRNSQEGKGLIKCNSVEEALEGWGDCDIGEDTKEKQDKIDATIDLAYCNGFDAGRQTQSLEVGNKYYEETLRSIENRRNEAVKIITKPLIKEPVFDNKKADIFNTSNASSELIKDKPKPLWKPVSELLANSCNLYIRWTDGDILPAEYVAALKRFKMTNTNILLEINDSRIKEVCTLTDFINDYEVEKLKRLELKKRIERLENPKDYAIPGKAVCTCSITNFCACGNRYTMEKEK